MATTYSEEFGRAATQAIGTRRLREIATPMGITTGYVSEFRQGRVPTRSMVIRFARACELDRRDTDLMLMAAGYAPVMPDEQEYGPRREKGELDVTFNGAPSAADPSLLASQVARQIAEVLRSKKPMDEHGLTPGELLVREYDRLTDLYPTLDIGWPRFKTGVEHLTHDQVRRWAILTEDQAMRGELPVRVSTAVEAAATQDQPNE